jgi:hypothetical protein
MQVNHKVLWNKLLDFDLDNPSSSYTFSDRLCKENNWTMEFTIQATLEYKKFIFLINISEKPQTPSIIIDEVWHLHLLYTESYWNDLCGGLLGKKIHHKPTKGNEEHEQFFNQFQETLALYKIVFEMDPPKNVWENSLSDSSHFTTKLKKGKVWFNAKINSLK